MKFKKIAAIVSAAALALALTGCGKEPNDPFANNSQNGQTSGATLNPFENKPTVELPDIPVNDASAFEYKYDSELGGMVINDYKLQSPKIHIPDELENEKVVKVDFSGVSKDITHIIMPDTAKEFEFSDQIKGVLQFVNIPNSVTDISTYAFAGCTSLTSIDIPDSVVKIGNGAFKDCTNLTSITIPDTVTKIGGDAFYNCTNIKATYKGKTYDYEHITDLNFEALKQSEDNQIQINYYAPVANSVDGKNFACEIGNPDGAKYYFYLDLYSDTSLSEEIYLSGLIAPGRGISSFQTNKVFPKGETDVVLVITTVQEDLTLVEQKMVYLTLNVSDE